MITQFKKCIECWEDFYSKTNESLVCPACKPKVKFQKKIKNRELMTKRNIKVSQKDYKQTSIIKQKLLREQEKQFGKRFCEECWKSFKTYEEHHIIPRSRLNKHPHKHNPRNILIICYKCHDKWHFKWYLKEFERKWIIKRQLWETYPELIKKENYLIDIN